MNYSEHDNKLNSKICGVVTGPQAKLLKANEQKTDGNTIDKPKTKRESFKLPDPSK